MLELGDDQVHTLRLRVYSENQTVLSQVRFFTASFVDFSKPDKETHITGWIDEHKKVDEWDEDTIYWVTKVRTHPGPNIWIPPRFQTQQLRATAETSNGFALDLYRRLSDTNGNILFSPYSISTALSMVYEGAK